MKEQLAKGFPLVLAVVIPLVGLLLALLRFSEGSRREGAQLLAATVLGAALWALLLSA